MSKTPESILYDIRHCIHSFICCGQNKGDNPKLEPDYVCSKQKFIKCYLYKEPFCDLREEFPSEYNT